MICSFFSVLFLFFSVLIHEFCCHDAISLLKSCEILKHICHNHSHCSSCVLSVFVFHHLKNVTFFVASVILPEFECLFSSFYLTEKRCSQLLVQICNFHIYPACQSTKSLSFTHTPFMNRRIVLKISF